MLFGPMNQVFSLKLNKDIVAGRFGEPPVPKSHAKNPTKVHVWAGISTRGAKHFFPQCRILFRCHSVE